MDFFKLTQARQAIKTLCDDLGVSLSDINEVGNKGAGIHEARCKIAKALASERDGAVNRYSYNIIATAMNKSKSSIYYMVNDNKKEKHYLLKK